MGWSLSVFLLLVFWVLALVPGCLEIDAREKHITGNRKHRPKVEYCVRGARCRRGIPPHKVKGHGF